MRILYHHRTRATDAQRIHILKMVEAFRALGHEVVMASLVDPEAGGRDPSQDAAEPAWKRVVRRIPFAYELVQLGYNAVGLPLLLQRIRRERIDFVYERYSLFNFAGVLSAKLSGLPIVLEVNSPFALEQSQERAIRAARLAAWTERVICNLATRVLVVSGPLRRILEENGVQGGNIFVLPNGVDRTEMTPPGESTALREALGLTGRTVIGFAGWFRPWHGLEELLRVFHGAIAPKSDAALLLIGDGPATPGLRQYVDTHGLRESVIFTGPVPHDRVPLYLSVVDIAVQPAANEYCCPMKLIEYMGLGKAIVAPRQENIEELVTNNLTARLFEPNDETSFAQALLDLIHDASLRRTLASGAKQAVELRGLSWERNASVAIEMIGEAVRV